MMEQPQRRIRVYIEGGGKTREVRVVADAPMSALLSDITTALGLPLLDAKNQPIRYHIAFKGQRLHVDETLLQVGVNEGDTLTLIAEQTIFPEEIQHLLTKIALTELNHNDRQWLERFLEQFSSLEQRLQLSAGQIERRENRKNSFRRRSSSGNIEEFSYVKLFNEGLLSIPEFILPAEKIYNIHLNKSDHPLFERLADLFSIRMHELASMEKRLKEGESPTFLAPASEDVPAEEERRTLVSLRLEQDIETFTEAEQQRLIRWVARCSETSEDKIKVLSVAPGSVRVMMEMPDDAACRLENYVRNNPNALTEWRLTSIDTHHLLTFVGEVETNIIVPTTILSFKCFANMDSTFEVHGKWNFESGDTQKLEAVDSLSLNSIMQDIGKRLPAIECRAQAMREGRRLYQNIFEKNSHLSRCFGEARGSASSESLTLCFAGPRSLLSIPYELLYDDQGPLVVRYPLCRRVCGISVRNTSNFDNFLLSLNQHQETLKILLIASDDTKKSDWDSQIALLATQIKAQAAQLGILTRVDKLPTDRASYNEVKEKLNKSSYHIIHFAGEAVFDSFIGENSGLYFWEKKSRQGKRKLLTARELGTLLADSQAKLVYLNAGLTGAVSDAHSLTTNEYLGIIDAVVMAGVPHVLGYRWPIIENSCRFAQVFYQTLFKMRSPAKAAFYGRREIYNVQPEQDLSWISPILVSQQA